MRSLQCLVTILTAALAGTALADASGETENPPVLRASQLLPPELLSGPSHRVAERVVNDGYMNHYAITSAFGDLDAQSTAELEIRVRELNAIAEMRKVSDLRQVQTGIEASADSLISGVGSFLVDPVAGVQGTVSGVNKLFGRANATFQGEEGQDDLLGFDKAKRAVATRFGVDVYSSNPVLQAELDRLAKARGTGSLALTGAMVPVGGAAGIALGATSATVKLNELVRDHSVADLEKINAERLAAMGVGQDVIDLFLDSPELSPRHQTAIVTALERMDGAGGRPLVVKQAVLTSSEGVALFRVRQLAMYLAHHERTAQIKRFVPADKYVISAMDANGDLITAMPVDHLAWTQNVQAIADSARSKLDVGARSHQLVLTGTISPLALASMKARGWAVVDRFDLGGL